MCDILWRPCVDKAMFFFLIVVLLQKKIDAVIPCESHNYYKNNPLVSKSSISHKWKHEPACRFASGKSKGQRPPKSGDKYRTEKLSDMYGTSISEIIHWPQCVKSLNCTKAVWPLRILRYKYIPFMYKCTRQNQQLDSMLYATQRTVNIFTIFVS